ncbi:GCN5 family acetyltransferase [Paenibacillus sp. FSL P4-0081]|uniref:arsinothricin resistance N-acetyltransferase ArsN1 family A n=1 Tax=Paenibacillus sp. FSL P4-0081 TaxID=1536769 RepID=UPI0004F6C774|nr:arsinothricin resistance N-acetyltransferase ArsN1 family A [Paenibacillus sp. FSL P4-0081]AIQ32488.1 GCN5 family acetyltransferase [Paenibacillus sp. FSL P4-0081]
MLSTFMIRPATFQDLTHILHIYNQGIEDRIATLESSAKDLNAMSDWFQEHQGRFIILVAEAEDSVLGWASLNRYSHRCAYDGVADLSIYIERASRGRGIGNLLLHALEDKAVAADFYKIVLFTFPFNPMAQGLYRKSGYREVGVFEKQGKLDGRMIDVMIMEKLLL